LAYRSPLPPAFYVLDQSHIVTLLIDEGSLDDE